MADVKDTDILTDGSPNVLSGLVKDSVTGKKKIVPLAIKELSSGVWGLDVGATIDAGDIEIGAVELKNGATDDRAVIESIGGAPMALDVNMVSGSISATTTEEFLTTPPTLTNTQTTPLLCDNRGNLKVNIASGAVGSSVESRGSIGALAVEIVDAAGAQITSFGSGTVKLSDTSGSPNVTVATKGSVGAMAVQIVDAAGAQITSFGSGTVAISQTTPGTTNKVSISDGSGNTLGSTGSALDINIKSGSIENTSFASTIADGADVTLGAKADARSVATDTTAVSAMSVLKEISYMAQNPASVAVTGSVTASQGTASNLKAEIVGNVAHAATDSGNPVKVGGKYVAAGVTLTDGQRGDAQLSSIGQVLVNQGKIAGEDFVNDVMLTSANKITPTISNVTCASVTTQYTYAFPAGTKKFMIKARVAADVVNFYWTTAAAPTAGIPSVAYITIPAAASYTEEGVKLASQSIFFCSPTAGAVVEIQSWQ